jgi:hypothetical protein
VTGTHHLIQLLVYLGSCELCPGWPGTAFQVSRIVGMSHWFLARTNILTRKCRINGLAAMKSSFGVGEAQ